MSVGFVHLSDIHFGQEKDGTLWVHNDVKERLVDDVRAVAKTLKTGRAAGIIVTGDIAYSGKADEYKAAGAWLDRVAEAAGCEITDIQVVPGNHDIDHNEITALTEIMLKQIADQGESALDRFLKADADRELLFRRFSAYQPFAAAYRCPLDTNGELAQERVAELAPGRSIRFIRLNSALVCSKKDEEGRLLLGARQRVLNEKPGEELVVLSHHPVHWFQDSDDALLYIRNRARVFISGHEHDPSVKTENVEDGRDLMMLAAGATIPPSAKGKYTYCYNFIEFAWCSQDDALIVKVYPRSWVNDKKKFDADDVRLGGKARNHTLASPNFRGASYGPARPPQLNTDGASETVLIKPDEQPARVKEESVADTYPLLLLRFFRDLSPAQRIGALASLGALPPNWNGALSEPFERRAFDGLVTAGRSNEIWNVIKEILPE